MSVAIGKKLSSGEVPPRGWSNCHEALQTTGDWSPQSIAIARTKKMEIDVSVLSNQSMPLRGNCSGVYFLFDEHQLVYVGQGWNCLLRVAEHTRKDSDKVFSSWTYIAIESEDERKQVERELRRQLSPKYNKV